MGLWEVHAEVQGPLRLVRDVEAQGAVSAYPGVRKVELQPTTGQQDVFELKCWLEIEGDCATVPAAIVWGTAADFLYRLQARLSLIVWGPVKVRGKDAITVGTASATGQQRVVVFGNVVELMEPVKITEPGLLGKPIDRIVARTMFWVARGIATQDPADRFLTLAFACNLIAPRFKGATGRVRTCEHCGVSMDIDPGDGEHFRNLCEHFGLSEALSREAWLLRSELVHGAVELTTAVRLKAMDLSRRLEQVVHAALGSLLGAGTLGSLPPMRFGPALLDMTLQPSEGGARSTSDKSGAV